jgi:hypothetical protein
MFKPPLNKLNEIKKQQQFISNSNGNNVQPARRLSIADLNNQLNEENFNLKTRGSITSASSISNDMKYKSVTLLKGPSGFGIAISEDRNNRLVIRGININGIAHQVSSNP